MWELSGAMSPVVCVYAGQLNRSTPVFLFCLLICLFLLDLQSPVHRSKFLRKSLALPY